MELQQTRDQKKRRNGHIATAALIIFGALFSVAIGTLQHSPNRGAITEPSMACTADPVLTPGRISPLARARVPLPGRGKVIDSRAKNSL